MSFWKQSLLILAVLAVAVAVWARFFPGASDTLAAWGLDWLPVATAQAPQPAPAPGGAPGGMAAQGAVIAERVSTATINDNLTAIGTGRANSSVVVNPFSAGRLTEVLVTSGTSVERGEIIARLDSESEEIAVDRARIALDDAEARLERITALVSSNTVTAVQRNEAELAVRNASLSLRDAELALERRSIVAPISGIVGIVPVSAGSYVTAQTEIVTIDDRSNILVDFWVPERFAGLIEVGAPIEATSIARSSEVFAGSISAVDNRIDAQSRTLRVQAVITNPADALRAGMSFRVSMRFPGDIHYAVNPLAIQWGTEGAFIWSVVDGVARRTPARIIQRSTDTVLVDADIEEGMLVVTEGIHAVRDGAPVRLFGGPADPAVSEADPAMPRAAGGT